MQVQGTRAEGSPAVTHVAPCASGDGTGPCQGGGVYRNLGTLWGGECRCPWWHQSVAS